MTNQAFTLPVFATKDYTIFKKLNGNRELYSAHIKKLVKIIVKDPNFTSKNPIKVNEKMEVIDGQHRLAAFTQYSEAGLGTPDIYYIKVDGLKLDDARDLNAGSKAWRPEDYARAYAEEGNKNYITYLSFSKKFNMNHNVLTVFLTQRPVLIAEFRGGNFQVKDSVFAKDGLTKMAEIGNYYPDWKLQHFGKSFFSIFTSPKYIHSRMMEQMEKYGKGLLGVPSRTREMIPALNMIYNWERIDHVDLLTN